MTGVAFLIVPGFNIGTLTNRIAPLRIANHPSPHPLYHREIATFDGGRISASNGLGLKPATPAQRNRRGELRVVLAWSGA